MRYLFILSLLGLWGHFAAGADEPIQKSCSILGSAAPLDFAAFYGVLKNLDNTTKEKWEASYDEVVQFHQKVSSLVASELSREDQLALARRVHDLGYWLGSRGQQVRVQDPKRLDTGATLPAGALARLTPKGRAAYDLRYENFTRADDGKTYNKLTSSDLDILSLDLATRQQFYLALGKQIPDDQLQNLTGSEAVMNLYHASFDEMEAVGAQIQSERSREAWFKQIVKNQVGAITSSVILEQIARSGSALDQPLKVDPKHTERDFLTWRLWTYALQYYGKDGYDQEPQVRSAYQDLPEDIRDLDHTIDQQVQAVLAQRPHILDKLK